MQQYDIIMFNMSSYSDWRKGIQNRNYHILHNLQKHPQIRKIVAIDFLPFNFKQMAKRYIKDIILNSHKGDIVYGDLTSSCYQVTSKIYVYSTIDSYFNQNIVTKELKRIQKALDIRNPILWSYNPLCTPYLNKLHEGMVIFDTVDNWCEHIAYTKQCYQKRLKKNYKLIADKADVIFMVSPNLQSFYKSFNRTESVYYIPNGVELDNFKKEHVTHPEPIEFFNQPELKNKKIIGYIGTIQTNRFDIQLIQYCAKNHPDKAFVLGGPIWKDSINEIEKELKPLNNVFFCGPIPRKDWVNYCSYFDVAMNPHKVNEFTHYTCPTKIYEYIACGKPVVSTDVCGADEFNDLIYTTTTPQEFSQALAKALEEDSQEKQEKRFKIAHQHYSWNSRVQKMLEIIESHPTFKSSI